MKLLEIVEQSRYPTAYKIGFIAEFFRDPLVRVGRAHGLIEAELGVLACLDFRDPLNSVDICETTHQPSNTVSRAVASLERKGLIRRAPDHRDARRALLWITEEGRSVYADVAERMQAAEREALSALQPEERAQLDALLAKVSRDAPRWSKSRLLQIRRG